MLSRVQELKQVYILNKFDPKKVYPSQKALKEVERMNRVSINENPDPWANFQDIENDGRLKKADIIHLV